MKQYLYVKTGTFSYDLVRDFPSYMEALQFLFDNREQFGIKGTSIDDPEFVSSKKYRILDEAQVQEIAQKMAKREETKMKVKAVGKKAGKAIKKGAVAVVESSYDMAKKEGATKEAYDRRAGEIELQRQKTQLRREKIATDQEAEALRRYRKEGQLPPRYGQPMIEDSGMIAEGDSIDYDTSREQPRRPRPYQAPKPRVNMHIPKRKYGMRAPGMFEPLIGRPKGEREQEDQRFNRIQPGKGFKPHFVSMDDMGLRRRQPRNKKEVKK